MKQKRYISDVVTHTLKRKMVFVGGPRQVGKTTLALGLLHPASVKNPQYYNWDNAQDQKKIIKSEIELNGKIVVFDEIHKYKKWRNFLKGLYDKNF